MIWATLEILVVLLERVFDDHPVAGKLWKIILAEGLTQQGWEKVLAWECVCVHKELQLSLSICVDHFEIARWGGETESHVEDPEFFGLTMSTCDELTKMQEWIIQQFVQSRIHFVQLCPHNCDNE